MMNFFVLKSKLLIIICFLAIMISCKRDANLGNLGAGETRLSIKISDNINFNDEGIISNKASVNKNLAVVNNQYIISDTFINNIVKDIGLSASVLIIESPKEKNIRMMDKVSGTSVNKANVLDSRQALQDFAWYTVVIFDKDNKFFKKLNYQHKKENEQIDEIILKQSQSYTAIIYSVNSETLADLPLYDGGSIENPKLISESHIEVTGNKELLFRKITIPPSSSAEQTLDIVLQQQFSNVKVSLIASEAAGLTIKSVTAYLETSSGTARKEFGDLTINRSGISRRTNLDFSKSNEDRTATTSYMIVNKKSEEATLKISNLVIGTIGTDRTIGSVSSPIAPFSSFTFDPGRQYHIILNITAADGTNPDTGDVTINGVTWAPYNAREVRPFPATSVSPHVSSTYTTGANAERAHGDYYQWGRNRPAVIDASSSSSNPVITNWNNTANTNALSWNGVALLEDLKELNPQKTSIDPCPTNYRVPTATEFTRLTGTTRSYIGNPVVAVTYTSTSNSSAKVTFPMQGYYAENDIRSRTSDHRLYTSGNPFVYLWSSYFYKNGNNYQLIDYQINTSGGGTVMLNPQIADNTKRALPIRCVKYK